MIFCSLFQVSPSDVEKFTSIVIAPTGGLPNVAEIVINFIGTDIELRDVFVIGCCKPVRKYILLLILITCRY